MIVYEKTYVIEINCFTYFLRSGVLLTDGKFNSIEKRLVDS